ncbi:MAG: ABC transporter ATP-binding protein [Anaerolineae bacterium]|nr:ABC transporter ATP-binding protein [Anaerolineae bacterium]
MDAVRCEDLRKRFGQVQALDGLTLKVPEGSVYGFLGPNGAGKTTTIRILTGLARATSGRAWVAGVELTGTGDDIAHRIGYLPEEPTFYGWMTPAEYLDYVGQVFRLPGDERRRRTAELLDLVGLSEVARRRVAGFSRGMRQRLGVAQALVNRPQVLFLDEPASALDPAGRREVLELVERLRGSTTVFMSTHILADVERVCDTVGIIARGKVVAEAGREELLSRYVVPAFELETVPEAAPALAGWAETARQEDWVDAVTLDGHRARVAVHDVPRASVDLLASLAAARLPLVRYEMVRPSLEDVFLRLVNQE